MNKIYSILFLICCINHAVYAQTDFRKLEKYFNEQAEAHENQRRQEWENRKIEDEKRKKEEQEKKTAARKTQMIEDAKKDKEAENKFIENNKNTFQKIMGIKEPDIKTKILGKEKNFSLTDIIDQIGMPSEQSKKKDEIILASPKKVNQVPTNSMFLHQSPLKPIQNQQEYYFGIPWEQLSEKEKREIMREERKKMAKQSYSSNTEQAEQSFDIKNYFRIPFTWTKVREFVDDVSYHWDSGYYKDKWSENLANTQNIISKLGSGAKDGFISIVKEELKDAFNPHPILSDYWKMAQRSYSIKEVEMEFITSQLENIKKHADGNTKSNYQEYDTNTKNIQHKLQKDIRSLQLKEAGIPQPPANYPRQASESVTKHFLKQFLEGE